MTTSSRLGFNFWPSGITQADVPANSNVLKLDGTVNLAVKSRTVAAQPASPVSGDAYILPAAPTGAIWSTFSQNDIVLYDSGTWYRYAPVRGISAEVIDEAVGLGFVVVRFTASWQVETTSVAPVIPFSFTVAVSDESTAITAGVSKITFYWPFAATLQEVFCGVSAQSSSGIVRPDVNKAGATIFTTRPAIDASEDTNLTGVAAVLVTTAFAKGDKMTIDIDDAGTGAKGLKLTFNGVY